MFCLLEDNRIVDSNNLPYEWKWFTTLISEKDKMIFLHCPDPRERKQFKIKKQSENVIDLIEDGDLLKIEYEGRMELCDFQDDEFNYANYLKNYYPNRILAIYKPNTKGDYIKVWEKKVG